MAMVRRTTLRQKADEIYRRDREHFERAFGLQGMDWSDPDEVARHFRALHQWAYLRAALLSVKNSGEFGASNRKSLNEDVIIAGSAWDDVLEALEISTRDIVRDEVSA